MDDMSGSRASTTQVRPIDIWAQLLTADSTGCRFLNRRTPLCRYAPLAFCPLVNENRLDAYRLG